MSSVSLETTPWFVYIIACSDGSLYTGVTKDVQRRLQEHQSQGIKCAKYLRGKGPLTLVFQHAVESKTEALRMEYLIKKLPKIKKAEIVQTQSLALILLHPT